MSDGKSFLKVDNGGSDGGSSFFGTAESCGICLSGVFVGCFVPSGAVFTLS